MARKLTPEELQRAYFQKDWTTLWIAADPWVKFVMAEFGRGDDDLFQAGREAAGKAVRTWNPLVAEFSTHICAQVRGAASDWLRASGTGGTGSRRQATEGHAVEFISLSDPADTRAAQSEDYNHGDDLDGGASHLDRLTYDDLGGFVEAEEELQYLDASQQIAVLVNRLPSEDRKFLLGVLYLGTDRAFSEAHGVPRTTVQRRMNLLIKKMGQTKKTCYIRGTEAHKMEVPKGRRSHRTTVRATEQHGMGFWPRGDQSHPHKWQRVVMGPDIEVTSSVQHSGSPWGEWSWKPTPVDVRSGAESRKRNYPWSGGAKKLIGLPMRRGGK